MGRLTPEDVRSALSLPLCYTDLRRLQLSFLFRVLSSLFILESYQLTRMLYSCEEFLVPETSDPPCQRRAEDENFDPEL
jgi:hypothetical protein